MIKRIMLLLLPSILLILNCTPPADLSSKKGSLLIIGGGRRPDNIMQKFVDLCGGTKAKIAVIPTASSYYKEAGPKYVKKFKELGVMDAEAFNILSQEDADSDSIVNKLKDFDGYFFGGGNQNKLTEYFLDSKAQQLFLESYQQGKSFGGTSAGAAIMSEIMLTGDGNWTILEKDSVKTARGFGFLDNVIIDQHFFKRKRFNRLLNAVIINRTKGIGIDEATSIWVKPDSTAQVIGESVVLVVDPKNAVMPEKLEAGVLTSQDLKLSIYKHNDTFRL